MAGYTYLNHLVPDADIQKALVASAIGIGLIYFGRSAASKITSMALSAAAPQSMPTSSIVIPEKRISLFGAFDFFVEAFAKYQDSVLGRDGRKYLPFTATIFLFIFLCNLIGLVPGMPSPTTTVWVNLAMALVVFFYFNYLGVKENGVVGYLKHFCGPIAVLAPLMFVIEILSVSLRVLTLNLRLYWNITADHIVVGIFTDLTKVGIPVVFYALGTFVCFMQAFVFTTLTMVYILLATQHEEGEHEEGNHH
jgi:F-type H+-transporting ATPase subunit a